MGGKTSTRSCFRPKGAVSGFYWSPAAAEVSGFKVEINTTVGRWLAIRTSFLTDHGSHVPDVSTLPEMAAVGSVAQLSAVAMVVNLVVLLAAGKFLLWEMEIVRELPLFGGLVPSAMEGLEGHIQMGEPAEAQIMLARVAGYLVAFFGHSPY